MPMDDRQKVGLGCGSLILIAVIVLVFGSIAVDGVNERILALDAKIQVLDKKTEDLQLLIAKQTAEIEELQALIEALREELRGAAQESGTQ
jgi:prefoldin subunit 5